MPNPVRHRPRHLLALALTAAVALGGACGNDDEGDDTTSSTTTAAVESTLSTMAPDTTGDAGTGTVPGDDGRGGTDTTVSGAVPGQNDDQLDPPADQPGGQTPEG